MCTDTSHVDLETATRVLERERRELVEERRAFERFARRVRRLEATTGAIRSPVAGATTHVAAAPSTGVSAVRDAYAETVMSVSHYEAVYDEPWLENLAGECSDELAAALEHHAALSPQLKRSLIAAANQAATYRSQLLEAVEAELESLEPLGPELAAIREDVRSLLDQPLDRLEFNALRLTRARLLELEERCDALAAKRQTQIRRRRRHLTTAGVEEFGRYLYRDCGSRHPVLAAIAAIGERIDRGRRRIDRLLATAT